MSLDLLLLPPAEEVDDWLQLASRSLQGYAPQPIVLRRTRSEQGPEQLEVRRFSPEPYLNLGAQLLLHPSGRLALSKLTGVRHLRRRSDSSIEDETYELVPLAQPAAEQLDRVRQRCLEGLAGEGYGRWSELSWEQRAELARFTCTLEQANLALAQSPSPERLRVLQLLVGYHPELLGTPGLKTGIEVVPWLLGQSDWNLDPAKVALARHAAGDDPAGAWELRTHPHALVRLRLVDLLDLARCDWLDWLSGEPEGSVRERLLQAIERLYTPSQVVEQLMAEPQAMRREALGWVLVHWKGDIQRSDDLKALGRALTARLGGENKTRLKGKLSRLEKARLFGR